MDLRTEIHLMGAHARTAAHALAILSTAKKNRILLSMADELLARQAALLEANALDLVAAREAGLSAAMLDRLTLTPERLSAIAEGVRQVAILPDPVGETLRDWTRPNGIRIVKRRVPIGVIGIIFESRPNVTVDAAVLCFKTGNATILRGGREAIHSNLALAAALQEGGERAGLPAHAIQLIANTDRESVRHMAEMDRYLDLIIPRGGAGLIETVVSLARMPVIKHYDGICHTYIDRAADADMAEAVAVNAKTQKPGVCNTMETLLLHREVAAAQGPRLARAFAAKGVQLRGDEAFRAAVAAGAPEVAVEPATEADWRTEYLDLILSVGVVDDLDAAIVHINEYGSHHSDAIITGDPVAARRFQEEIDSAAVFWNCSTRFSDGGEFGFGAEIGISTDKLHARGPMGLEELTSYKYLVEGGGQIRG
ncbi:MAG: glutamate-5-semialdehyde dehydrogenase [Verrucomicrobiales bacterium]